MGVILTQSTGLLKLRWLLDGDSEEMVSTIGLDNIATITEQEQVDAAVDEWQTAFPSSVMGSEWTMVGGSYTFLDAGGLPITVDRITQQGGALGITTPSNQVAVLARKLTASGGRRNRGRMFLPPAYLDRQQTGPTGLIGTAYLDTYQDGLDAWRAAPMGSVTIGGLISLLHSAAPIASTPITNLLVETKVATQRRRLRP